MNKPLSELPDPLPIPTPRRSIGSSPVDLDLRPPGSKSLTNRLVLLGALCPGVSRLIDPLVEADDARRMIAAVQSLGAGVEADGSDLRITGVGGRWRVDPGSGANGVRLDLGNAGTATRFLAAAALLSSVPITIDGSARMRQRPIGQLGDALSAMGASVSYGRQAGFVPMTVAPPPSLARVPASIRMPPAASSQFVSALLLISPWLPRGLTLRLHGAVTSRSYVRMTLGLLESLGAGVRTSEDLSVIRVQAAPVGTDSVRIGLGPFQWAVEPDASGATYFLAAAALVPGLRCRIPGLGSESLQGDAGFADLLARAGAEVGVAPTSLWCVSGQIRPVLADLSDMPDAAMTLASVLCFADGPSVLTGLQTLRVKECDRIAALKTELGRIGVVVEDRVHGDEGAISITPPPGGVDRSQSAPPITFDTYDDHRMAMSLALIGLARPNVSIRDPACVDKTYPTFWKDLGGLIDGADRA